MNKYLRNLMTVFNSRKELKLLKEFTPSVDLKYSIGITTFDKRFEKYFIPLLKQIKFEKPDIEIIVSINGNYKNCFNQNYRKDILNCLSNYDNVFPVFFTEFRALAKMWNTILIHSSNQYILLLNDDISIDRNFWSNFEKAIVYKNNKCFTINKSWSHIFLNRDEINQTGWFDERLLGIGEEDGDMAWRYEMHYQNKLDNIFLKGIFNHVEMNDCEQEFTKHGNSNKYSAFNREFILKKYIEDDINGEQHGLFPKKVICKVEDIHQYPYENFYWQNKNKF